MQKERETTLEEGTQREGSEGVVTEKTCRMCRQTKPVTLFNTYVMRGSDVAKKHCVECEVEKEKSLTLRAYLQHLVEKSRDRVGYMHKVYAGDYEINADFLLQLWREQNGRCAMTGLPLRWQKTEEEVRANKWGKFLVSIDRIDSDLNYLRSNVRLTASAINFMQSNLTDTEFIFLCKCVAEGEEKWE